MTLMSGIKMPFRRVRETCIQTMGSADMKLKPLDRAKKMPEIRDIKIHYRGVVITESLYLFRAI